jgi:Pyridoxamine 5'-phosphate oxidase
MTTWDDFAAAAPDLADEARAIFERHRHKTMATLRRDGSPRISGTELQFKDGELWLGSMPDARKAQDLLQDPRVAIHSNSADPKEMETESAGDAKIAGRAVEVTDADLLAEFGQDAPPGPFHLFRLDVNEVVVTKVGDPPDHLVIDFWTATAGRRTVQRK